VPDSGWRCADPSDDKFLHLALAAGADALVTADRALLEVRDFPLPILKSGQWIARAGR
jgi:predicted nucleic acid-binding protein